MAWILLAVIVVLWLPAILMDNTRPGKRFRLRLWPELAEGL